jgi:prophage antirepressor-like protein
MSAPTIFAFDSHAVRVHTDEHGEPWFVAADVLSVLELDRKALERIDEDEKGVNSIHTLGGNQDMTVVNEPGLYSLILGSRKPDAKTFKRWVTHEVLPAIRKTGRYVHTDTPQPNGRQRYGATRAMTERVDAIVASDRAFRAHLRSASQAGMGRAKALAYAGRMATVETGYDMVAALGIDVAQYEAQERANELPVVDTVGEFMAAWQAGELSGLALMPAKTLDLFDLYRAWVGVVGYCPTSQSHLLAILRRDHGASVQRKGYTVDGQRCGPHGFVLFASTPVPHGCTQSDWLGRCAKAVREAVLAVQREAYV